MVKQFILVVLLILITSCLEADSTIDIEEGGSGIITNSGTASENSSQVALEIKTVDVLLC